jgi:hypothetical protein
VYGAPAPSSGTPVFYGVITLNNGVDGMLTFTNVSPAPTASIASASLVAGASYSIAVYVGSTPQGVIPVGSPTNGTLTFASALDATMLPVGQPITIELIKN